MAAAARLRLCSYKIQALACFRPKWGRALLWIGVLGHRWNWSPPVGGRVQAARGRLLPRLMEMTASKSGRAASTRPPYGRADAWTPW